MANKFMKRAIELSRQKMRENSGGPFAAVVVYRGQIVGEGWNEVTSTNDPSAHAEVQAIRKACRRLKRFHLKGAVIYTSCEPCPMCLAAIYWAHVDRIYYANSRKDAANIQFDDDFIYREVAKPIAKRKIPMKQLSRAEAQKVFREWEEKTDKITY